jgi:glycosyltransferase involved in cell wall biosynthesis
LRDAGPGGTFFHPHRLPDAPSAGPNHERCAAGRCFPIPDRRLPERPRRATSRVAQRSVTRILLVPDLQSERWLAMDRYASRLAAHLPHAAPDLGFALASPVSRLTFDERPLPLRPYGDREGTEPSLATELSRYAQRYIRYPAQVRLQPADLLHVLDHTYAHLVRVAGGTPTIVTVHDLLPVLTVRRRTRLLKERARNVLLRYALASLRRARAWIVGTEWLRGELATWLGRDTGIHVVPYGVDDAFFDPPPKDEPRAAVRAGLGIPADAFVVLHVGSVVERKNIPAVFAAVQGLRERGVPAWLLQVGGPFTERHVADLAQRGIRDVVVQVPDAPERQLRAAYHASDVLLFPSHYEGFGLPLLEAMASGLPVVTSGAGALSEVAGDGALVVPSRDPERYVDAVITLAEDACLGEGLRARGRKRASGFRWTETARRTAEVYRSLLRHPRP